MTKIEPNIVLSEGQIAEFWERGYVALPAITSADEVKMLRGVFERERRVNTIANPTAFCPSIGHNVSFAYGGILPLLRKLQTERMHDAVASRMRIPYRVQESKNESSQRIVDSRGRKLADRTLAILNSYPSSTGGYVRFFGRSGGWSLPPCGE